MSYPSRVLVISIDGSAYSLSFSIWSFCDEAAGLHSTKNKEKHCGVFDFHVITRALDMFLRENRTDRQMKNAKATGTQSSGSLPNPCFLPK